MFMPQPFSLMRRLSWLFVQAFILLLSQRQMRISWSSLVILLHVLAGILRYEMFLVLMALVRLMQMVWLLLGLYSELNFTISNSIYRQKIRYKITWTHLRSKHGQRIDFIIIRRYDISDVCNSWLMWSQNETQIGLVRGRLKIHVRWKIRMHGVKVLDFYKLKQKDVCANLTERHDCLDFSCILENFRNQIYSIGVDVFGFGVRKHLDDSDNAKPAISQLLEKKR